MSMSERDEEQGRGLPVGWGPWQPAGHGFWTLARRESLDGTGIVAEAAEDGRWVVFPGGGAKGTAVARPGESATSAAQRAAVAALWARDGFGVGEVRGLVLDANYVALVASVLDAGVRTPIELPGLAGMWTLTRVSSARPITVDAARAPVAEPAPAKDGDRFICHVTGDWLGATFRVDGAAPDAFGRRILLLPVVGPQIRWWVTVEDLRSPLWEAVVPAAEPASAYPGAPSDAELGRIADDAFGPIAEPAPREPPAPTGDPGADLTELLPGLPAAVATLRGIASLQLGEPYREIAQQVALGAELLLGERATQPKALASYLDVQWSDEPMREGETVAEQAIRLLEDRREKQDIATRTVLAQGAEIATLRARVDELEAAVRQVEQERSCDLAVLDATAANLHSAERRLATLGAPTPLDLAVAEVCALLPREYKSTSPVLLGFLEQAAGKIAVAKQNLYDDDRSGARVSVVDAAADLLAGMLACDAADGGKEPG